VIGGPARPVADPSPVSAPIDPGPVGAVPPEVEAAVEPTVEPAPPSPIDLPPPTPVGRPTLESRFAQRWLVWLGALALAMGGLFAAGWAIEQGLVGPRLRLLGAALLGLALIALGERARRGATPARVDGETDYVAPALVAGGLCALYGAAAAAHLGYALVGPGAAFALLGLTSAFGVALGLRFGPLVPVLGSLGAYATPAIVTAETPSAWALFVYLGVVALGLGALARLTGRGWVAWINLAGAVAWQLAWLAASPSGEPGAAPGAHLLTVALAGLACASTSAGGAAGLGRAARVTVGAAAFLHLPLLWATDHGPGVVATLLLLSGAAIAVAWRVERERWLAVPVAAADLLAAASWRIGLPDGPATHLRDPSAALDPAFWLPPEATPLATAHAVVGAAYAAVGFVASRRARHPGFWASLSAAVSILALASAYARLEGLAVSPGYAALALALAAALLLAAERSARPSRLVPALGAYAVGVVGALALACAMVLEDAWLTVALASLLPAMAWVGRRLDLDAVRRPAWVVAAVVMVRVGFDVDVLVGARGALRLLYAYGAPLVAFASAARLFRHGPRDPLAELLTGGAVLLWLLLAAQLVRQLVGTTGAEPFGLAERALDALALLGTGYALLRWHRADPVALVPRFGWQLLVGAGGAVALLGQVVEANPLATGEPVGSRPVLNLLLIAYAAPAILAILVAGTARRLGAAVWVRSAAVVGHVLAIAWLTLEVRRWFQGPVLTGPTGEGEWLAYSAAWLAWAGLLLALGVRLDRRPLRVAGLAIAALAVAKTFLFDLAGLGGLYRAVSFLALGIRPRRRRLALPPARRPTRRRRTGDSGRRRAELMETARVGSSGRLYASLAVNEIGGAWVVARS
jgi:uncharacterized membrane protein